MTRKQNAALAAIARAALDSVGTLRDVEFKSWEVTPCHRSVIVTVETGYVDDEESLLSVFCRTRGYFVVGPRGRVEARAKRGRQTKARRYPLIYGFAS